MGIVADIADSVDVLKIKRKKFLKLRFINFTLHYIFYRIIHSIILFIILFYNRNLLGNFVNYQTTVVSPKYTRPKGLITLGIFSPGWTFSPVDKAEIPHVINKKFQPGLKVHIRMRRTLVYNNKYKKQWFSPSHSVSARPEISHVIVFFFKARSIWLKLLLFPISYRFWLLRVIIIHP